MEDLMTIEENLILDLTSERRTTYCSIIPKSEKEETALFNGVNNPDKRLREFVNMPLEITNVYVEVVNTTNKTTGEVLQSPRIILFDKDGVSYTAVSLGVYGALKKLFSFKGTPDKWNGPITIIPKTVSKGEYNILTFLIK